MDESILDREVLAEPHFAAVFDRLPNPALIVGRDGQIIAANRAARQKFRIKYPRSLHMSDLFRGSDAQLTRDLLMMASSGRLLLKSRTILDSEENRLHFTVSALREGKGPVSQFLLTEDEARKIGREFRNITEQMRQANDLAARERYARRRLQESHEQLEKFSYMAAHDLQAPLRNIASLMTMLSEDYQDVLPEDAMDLVALAESSVGNLQELIDDLLTHARAGVSELNRQRICVGEVVDRVRQRLAAPIASADGEILCPENPGEIEADPTLLHQLLENLIANAIKYRAADRAPRISIRLTDSLARGATLTVEDNGRGFDDAEKKRIFEPFQRLEHPVKTEGTGIGLAICQTICKRHGWQIRATGKPGAGARFEISNIH